ncbi:MAG TPA: TraR/DksA family transcriptional regulator [Deltaproteobacteria bacterium]|mgnify:CR=1 FL=1|nr:TraR/DksA family transcriptional regulator [Deltaproteobacteria bacterium]HPJ93736.1 TraR/DksA family transcriptional regulator [Deltaproteobacteria bacterium]HPR50660.1 TraR/DksA family transcriptional regulator [Deltaproteobacteria bacterium]
MLRKDELLEVREILMEMKKEILQNLEERIKSNDMSEQREIGDIFDDADLEQSREFNLLLSTRERQKLDQIDSALSKLDNGEYGYCEDCDEAIPVGRLRAMPFATLCVKCKSERESVEGHAPVYIEEKG